MVSDSHVTDRVVDDVTDSTVTCPVFCNPGQEDEEGGVIHVKFIDLVENIVHCTRVHYTLGL